MSVALGGLSAGARAQTQTGCDVEAAQRLFGQQSRPTETVQRLLAACDAAGSTDYRVYMFQGVMAREAGDREQAIVFLRKAHDLAPRERNPALELAFTLEERHPQEAAKVYQSILADDPGSRPALLGLARIERGAFELDKARAIYDGLLKTDPQDADALNGLAWLQLAERNRVAGQAGFEKVLALHPGNEEAKVGLSMAPDVYKYVLDVSGSYVSTASGSSWGFGGFGLIGVTAFDTLELGWYHYTNELQTLTAIGVAVLPSDDVRIGYNRLVPLSYAFSVVYDYRAHSGLPTEHWIDASGAYYFADWLRGFFGYRQAFGAYQWDARLVRFGLGISLSQSWEITGTVYDAAQAIYNNWRDIWSWVVEVNYHGPHNMLLVAGAGYAPLIDNTDLHARAILPLTERVAVQAAIVHNSINADTRATLGLRYNW
ncbi:MAG: tetratricopeptide repeat protein [Reyranellaceae bacterium]